MMVADWIGTGAGRAARARLLHGVPRDRELTESEVRALDALRVRQLRRAAKTLAGADTRVNWRGSDDLNGDADEAFPN